MYDLEELDAWGRGHWVMLTGCCKVLCGRRWRRGSSRSGRGELGRSVALFGTDRVVVELTDHQ